VAVPPAATSRANPPLAVTVFGCVENRPMPVIASVSSFDAIATFGTSMRSSHVPLALFGSAAARPGTTATRAATANTRIADRLFMVPYPVEVAKM
jgi:hypothetical protein